MKVVCACGNDIPSVCHGVGLGTPNLDPEGVWNGVCPKGVGCQFEKATSDPPLWGRETLTILLRENIKTNPKYVVFA